MQYTSWHNITVGQYQEVYEVRKQFEEQKDNITFLDADVTILSILTRLPVHEIDQWPVKRFKEAALAAHGLMGQVPDAPPMRRMKLPGGSTVSIEHDVTKITAGQYAELMAFCSEDGAIVANLHKIMATLSTPLRRNWMGRLVPDSKEKDHAKLAEQFKATLFIHSFGTAVFFCRLFQNFLKASAPYLAATIATSGLMKSADARLRLEALLKVMDGYTPPEKLPSSRKSLLQKYGSYLLRTTLTTLPTYERNQKTIKN